MEKRTCVKCKAEKSLDEKNFRVRTKSKDGSVTYRTECRKCEISITKEYRKKNPDFAKTMSYNYREKTRNSLDHIAMRLVKESKKRAKQKGLEHSISKNDLSVPKHCPVLGHELKSIKGGVAGKESPTLDRKDNNRGYTKDNVQIISFEANTIKGSATSDKLYKVALYAEECEGRGNRFTRWLKRMVLSWF